MTLTEEGIAIVPGDEWLSKQIKDERRLDVHYARAIIDMMRIFIPEGGTVCDVGACLGDHTIGYADFVGPSGHVYAYEPNPVAFDCLRYNMRERPWVQCFQMALADRVSRCDIGPEPNNPTNLGMATLRAERPDGTIKLTTLDLVAKDWSRLDFLKIDVEGVEHALLDGAHETIARFTPPILIEVNRMALHNHGAEPNDVYRRLARHGYAFAPICVQGISMDPATRIQEDEVDVVCVQRDRPGLEGFMSFCG